MIGRHYTLHVLDDLVSPTIHKRQAARLLADFKAAYPQIANWRLNLKEELMSPATKAKLSKAAKKSWARRKRAAKKAGKPVKLNAEAQSTLMEEIRPQPTTIADLSKVNQVNVPSDGQSMTEEIYPGHIYKSDEPPAATLESNAHELLKAIYKAERNGTMYALGRCLHPDQIQQFREAVVRLTDLA